MASMRVVEPAFTVTSPAVDSTLASSQGRASTMLSTSFQVKATPTPACRCSRRARPRTVDARAVGRQPGRCRRHCPAVAARVPAISSAWRLSMVLMWSPRPAPTWHALAGARWRRDGIDAVVGGGVEIDRPLASRHCRRSSSLSLPSLFQLNDRPTPALPPKGDGAGDQGGWWSRRAQWADRGHAPLRATLSGRSWCCCRCRLIDAEPRHDLALAPATEADQAFDLAADMGVGVQRAIAPDVVASSCGGAGEAVLGVEPAKAIHRFAGSGW